METLFTKNSETINRFLFCKVSPLYAAIFRIILCIFFFLTFYFQNFREVALFEYSNFYPEFYDQYLLTFWYRLICGIALFLFGIGFKSRLFGFISVVLFAPVIYPDGFGISRLLFVMALFFFSFIKSDARLSVMSLLNKTSAIHPSPMWPVRLLQIELSLLYGVNAILKTTPVFLSGEVLRIQSMVLRNYVVDLSDGYLHLDFISIPIPVFFLGIGTVVSEYFLAIGFWFKKIRIFTALFGIAFHVMLTQFITIGNLDVVTVFFYIPFFIPWEKSDGTKSNFWGIADITKKAFNKIKNIFTKKAGNLRTLSLLLFL